jgi:hypothetical protein
VQSALNEALLPRLGPPARLAAKSRSHLRHALKTGDLTNVREIFHALYASIPHDWYRNNPLADYEGHYASIFYSYLSALGMDIRVEDATNKGRIDLALRAGSTVYLFEFKVVGKSPEGSALTQLQAKGYADKYRAPDVRVTLVGIEFGREARNLVGFEVAEG